MARCLNLNKAGEYAVAALARLALRDEATPVSIGALARQQGLPQSFLAKIVARCVRAGLLRARKGAAGGVMLARPAQTITLLEIIEAFEGPLARESCVFYSARACEGPSCPMSCPLRHEEERTRRGLASATLAEMAVSLRGADAYLEKQCTSSETLSRPS